MLALFLRRQEEFDKIRILLLQNQILLSEEKEEKKKDTKIQKEGDNKQHGEEPSPNFIKFSKIMRPYFP